jgi:2-methylfumaryl-CoA hydratase
MDTTTTHRPAAGRFFEDFRVGETLIHATPRTLTDADAALYIALTGARHAPFSARTFAESIGLAGGMLDPLLVFHVVFGKSVPDVSLNAVANLGYAEGRFLRAVRPGDTLRAQSTVIGLKENSNRTTGVVHVRTRGLDQHDRTVLDYVRWVMVNKRDPAAPAPGPEAAPPRLAPALAAADLAVPEGLDFASHDDALSGSPLRLEDYSVGQRIDHVDGMTVEEAEHQIATRLYQNTARVHFDALGQASSRFGRRLIYGGVAISTARALSFNGLANAGIVLGLNAGRHVAPLFAGDTVHAWSEILETAVLAPSVGALRVRHVATRNRPCADFPDRDPAGAYDPAVILDLDLWCAIPRRG